MTELDRKIDFVERKILAYQSKILEQKEKTNTILRSLEHKAKELEDVKKEWVRKRNLEHERVSMDIAELRKRHRLAIEDLRHKYEIERDDRLRLLKITIREHEEVIESWHKKKTDAVAQTMNEKAQIDSRHQAKLNVLLRDEQSASRRGVVRQRRLLEAPNVFSMEIEKNMSIGMKRKQAFMRRHI